MRHEDGLGIPDDALPYIGKHVKVTLAHDDPEGVVTGVLLDADVWGEVEIDTADGVRWCWPALEIEESPS